MSAVNTWWARRWEQLQQELGIGAESGRGTPAARVKTLEVLPGAISAVVQDRDAGACTVAVRVEPLRDEQWDRVGEQLSSLVMVNAQILSGAMPPEIEQVFTDAGAHLLPQRGEVTTACSCCSTAPCRHLPLIFALFTEMLNDDPGLLFTLRGRDRQQVLRAVREARSAPQGAAGAPNGSAEPPAADGAAPATGANHLVGGALGGGLTPLAAGKTASGAPSEESDAVNLAAQLDQYWGNRKLLKQFHHHISPPVVELSLLRRLGPINTSDDAMALYEQMVAIYRRITEDALALAYATDEEMSAGGNGNGNGSGNGNHA